MKKREASFTLRFRAWLRANPMHSGAYELKQTETHSLPFDAVKDHQVDALVASKSKDGFLYKIGDDSRGFKPFDCFYLRNSFAWVVIKYPTLFVIIDIDAFLLEKQRSSRKSLTSMRAVDISHTVVKL